MVDKKMVLNDGYAHAVTACLESYLTDDERIRVYKEKIMARANECKCSLTEEEAVRFIGQQMHDMDMMRKKNDSPVALRFQSH